MLFIGGRKVILGLLWGEVLYSKKVWGEWFCFFVWGFIVFVCCYFCEDRCCICDIGLMLEV